MKNVALAAILAICLIAGLSVFEAHDKTSEKKQAAVQEIIKEERAVRVAIVGDIMLGREVGTLMDKNGYNYPLQKIVTLLKNFDLSVGNFEGTVLEKYNYHDGLDLKFSFAPNALRQLINANFGVVSLANNHAYDYGVSGFEETKAQLQKLGISPVGHPYDINKGIVTTVELKTRKLTFIGFNATVPKFNLVTAINLIKKTKSDSPDSLIVALIHWGNEYEVKQNAAQESLARAFVDAGVRVVIGHHPHVAQGIEKYKNGIIFYSLGNFIFDQNFSEETQAGMVVGMELSGKEANFGIFPIISRASQPTLMTKNEKKNFLGRIASSSPPTMTTAITSGLIKL